MRRKQTQKSDYCSQRLTVAIAFVSGLSKRSDYKIQLNILKNDSKINPKIEAEANLYK